MRCGIALYGVSPFGDDPAAHGLRARAALDEPRRRACATLAPGQSAGYGRRLIADRPLRVAYVPVGYADGYPRLASGRAEVLVRGGRRPVAATISMDQLTCVVDERVQLDDEVVLLGVQGDERITAEELAVHAETIGYEIVCATELAARRGSRTYVGMTRTAERRRLLAPRSVVRLGARRFSPAGVTPGRSSRRGCRRPSPARPRARARGRRRSR